MLYKSKKALDPFQIQWYVSHRELLAINPDNYKYHSSLQQVLGLEPLSSGEWSDRQRKELMALYGSLAESYPKSTTPPRIQLDFLVSPATAILTLLCSLNSLS